MNKLVIPLVMLVGCVSQDTPAISDIIKPSGENKTKQKLTSKQGNKKDKQKDKKNSKVKFKKEISIALKSLEDDLLLSLWLYLQQQKDRFKRELKEKHTTAKKEAIKIIILIIKQQSDEVWKQILTEQEK